MRTLVAAFPQPTSKGGGTSSIEVKMFISHSQALRRSISRQPSASTSGSPSQGPGIVGCSLLATSPCSSSAPRTMRPTTWRTAPPCLWASCTGGSRSSGPSPSMFPTSSSLTNSSSSTSTSSSPPSIRSCSSFGSRCILTLLGLLLCSSSSLHCSSTYRAVRRTVLPDRVWEAILVRKKELSKVKKKKKISSDQAGLDGCPPG